MSPKRTVLFALLVVLAGCAGSGGPGGRADETTTRATEIPATTTTTPETTEPHTAQGTSHIDDHLTVRVITGVDNVTVTLAPDGDEATFEVDAGAQRSFSREIHDRGHDVRVVVERDDETVFDETVQGYQYYRLTVHENETSVSQSVV